MVDAKFKSKMHSDDRILMIRKMAGVPHRSSAGLLDARLFNGENNLHALRSPINNLWMLAYDHGILPQPLRQQFTGWSSLYNFTKDYLSRRGLEITEVVDKYDET